MSRRNVAIAIGVGGLLLVAAGLFLVLRDKDGGGLPSPPRPSAQSTLQPEGEVSVSYPEEPESLNPYLYAGDTNATRDLLRPVLPTLLSIRPDLKYAPALATKVPSGKDITSDPFSVTYRLRKEAVWSDGTPITANDVRFTWEVLRNPQWQIADRRSYEHVTDVAVVDQHTVRLQLDGPYAAWKDLFSAGDFILPKHALEGKDFAAELANGVPVSGGPFLIEAWTPGLEIIYAANPKWWGEGPGLQKVHAYFVPDVDIALELLERKRMDVVFSTTQVNLEGKMKQIEGVEVASRFGSAWWEIGFNTQAAGVRERAFRVAIAHGLDRAGFTEALVRSGGRPLHHLAPGRELTPAFEPYRKDFGLVQQNLSAAGFSKSGSRYEGPGGVPIGITAPASNAMAGNIQRATQKGLRDAGLQLEIRNPDPDILYARWRMEGRFDLAIWERRGTPSMSLTGTYRSDRGPLAGANYTRIGLAEIDTALETADRTLRGNDGMNDLMLELGKAVPALPVFEAKAFLASRGVDGTDPNATIDGPLWNLEKWRRK